MPIVATARVLRNLIELDVSGDRWTCRPVAGTESRVARPIALLFSTTYETFRTADGGAAHSTVYYHPKRDELIIQIGEQKWRTRSSLFGPMSFEYGGSTYHVSEKLTGRYGILREDQLVAVGDFGFRSCTLREYPPDLEPFLANFALGYLVRSLWWGLFR